MSSHHSKKSASRLRVRIHLNLAQPDRAESSIKVQSENGGWITLAYGHDLIMENVVPVVHTATQKKIAETGGRKSPHAFLEGDLVSFAGRLRANTPAQMDKKKLILSKLKTDDRPSLTRDFNTAASINYNPRFASCFYQDQQNKDDIDQKLISAKRLIVRGWTFRTIKPVFKAFEENDRVQDYKKSMAQSSEFERLALKRGRKNNL